MPPMPTDLPPNDRALMAAAVAGHEWSPTGENKVLRATTIRALCLGLWDGVVVDPKGVRVKGARIVGELDLSFGTGRGALSLQHCHFDEQVVIQEGRLPALWLSGSHLAKGLSGDGARIDGDLFCSDGFHSIGEVRLLGAQIGGDVSFDGATLDGKDSTALSADRVAVKGGLFCNDGFHSIGEVRLLGAQIGGDAFFNGATLDGKDGEALSARRMVITGGLFCGARFQSIGKVSLLGAQIGATASFNGATLDGKDGEALYADGIAVKGGLLCGEGFRSSGEVRFLGAQIGGNASFDGAMLDGNGGEALSADGIVVRGDLFCIDGFHSIGEVRLLGAQIGGDASFIGATLDGKDGEALSADGMEVKGSLFCSDGFHSIGEVRLLGAQIGGTATFTGATLDGKDGEALTADGMVVTGNLFCRKDGGKNFQIKGAASLVGARIGGLIDWRPEQWTGELNLAHAVVGQWRDAWGASAKEEKGESSITLNHFAYGAFLSHEGMKADSDTRIKWVEAAQGENFTPGPYRTLARVLRAAGDDRGAAAVGLALARARAQHRLKELSRPWNLLYRLWTSLLDWGVGHGYRPWQGAAWLGGWLILGTILFSLGAPTPYCGPGIIKPADPTFISVNKIRNFGQPGPTSHGIKYDDLPPEYTPFSAFWYSFDTLVPLVDLGQERAWSPSPLTPNLLNDICGWLLLFYLYIHIIAGWVLTTLTVVAMTGLIKRDKEEE